MLNLKSIRFRRILILLALYGSFLIFLLSTDPRKLKVGWLILPFLWVFACLFLTAVYLIDWLSPRHSHTRRQTLIASLFAAVPAVMLLLDSVDQLTLKDGLLIGGMATLGVFYVNKIRFKRNNF